MRLLGQKSADVFTRYDVVALDDLASAVARAERASGTLAVRSEREPDLGEQSAAHD